MSRVASERRVDAQTLRSAASCRACTPRPAPRTPPCYSAALVADLRAAKALLDDARPTAVNLTWATGRVVDAAAAYSGAPGMTADALRAHVLEEAQALAEEDVAINTAIARHGAALVPQGANILHHCNTGALATVDVGTALGVIYGGQ